MEDEYSWRKNEPGVWDRGNFKTYAAMILFTETQAS